MNFVLKDQAEQPYDDKLKAETAKFEIVFDRVYSEKLIL